jgi:hydroxymethylbilane synthase
MSIVRLGTRGSALALVQAELVASALKTTDSAEQVEIVTITTSGDDGRPLGDKSRWIDTIESALAAGKIDLAIHSAKDVPGAAELADGMSVCAVLDRADARDALIGATTIEELPHRARVGTSSLRRASQLLAERPDLRIVELRGNVPTRLEKLESGQADAIVLAAAGLQRLGLEQRIGGLLDPTIFVPAPGQGILALEGRELPEQMIDPSAQSALDVERRVVEGLGATCETPVGCYDDGTTVHVYVGTPDGRSCLRDNVTADTAQERARLALERLELMGAHTLLEGRSRDA